MTGFLEKLSLVPAGLRCKLAVAFVLMSLIPLAIGVYLAWRYIFFPGLTYPWDVSNVSAILGVTILIALLGFKVSKDIISPIVDMAIKAKIIANGDFSQSVEITTEDEVGELGSALNTLTRRIRENMEELKEYGERTREINIEIGKKSLVLSGLLQIGHLISQGSPMSQVLDIIVEKVSQIEENSAVFLMLAEEGEALVMKASRNLASDDLRAFREKIGEGFLGRLALSGKIAVLDRRAESESASDKFLAYFGLKNCIAAPISIHKKGVGVLCVGNGISDYEFMSDDIELAKLFTKQVGIVVENDALIKRAKEFSIKDELTGLYNEKYVTSRLEEEIRRAILYQRPCAFLILSIDDLTLYHEEKGELSSEETIKRIGKIIEANVTEVDRVGRLSGDEFAVVMPEKSKRQARAMAESLRQRVEALGISGSENYPRKFVTVSGGVSENPIDGSSAGQLIKKARMLLDEAKAQGKNVVAA